MFAMLSKRTQIEIFFLIQRPKRQKCVQIIIILIRWDILS